MKEMQKNLRLLASLILLAVTGCRTLPQANLNPAGEHLKVVTYNVHVHGKLRGVADFLNAAQADIVFLQETHKEWDVYLDAQLQPPYSHVFYHHHPAEGGMAILSRYPLREPQIFYTTVGWFPAIYAKTSTPLGEIGLLNVHLKPPLTPRGRLTPGSLTRASHVHLEEIDTYLGKIDPNLPTLIAGDFNEDDSGRACRRLEQLGFVNALRMFDRSSHTWWYYVGFGFTLRKRLDHIFVGPEFECTGAMVFDIRASDHEPVLAAIRTKTVE